jgi:hypothetical protein
MCSFKDWTTFRGGRGVEKVALLGGVGFNKLKAYHIGTAEAHPRASSCIKKIIVSYFNTIFLSDLSILSNRKNLYNY